MKWLNIILGKNYRDGIDVINNQGELIPVVQPIEIGYYQPDTKTSHAHTLQKYLSKKHGLNSKLTPEVKGGITAMRKGQLGNPFSWKSNAKKGNLPLIIKPD